jgi:alkylation response protein AidB-like acyl-CoA dehydrogenase
MAMNFLKHERAALEQLLPGLDAALGEFSLMEMERPGNPSIPLFRELGGPGLLIPEEFGGRGASPLAAARAQRAIASRAPSLAVATTMHHFTIATILEIGPQPGSPEGEILEQVAGGNLIVASGFAEGRPGASIQSATVKIEPGPEGHVILNGSKKPCSLSHSMDLFVASTPPLPGMEAGLACVMLPADTQGLERRPFWTSPILAGAESDEVALHNVVAPEDSFIPLGGPGRVNDVQDRGFLWFELLISAVYIGIASALVERALQSGRGGPGDRVAMAMELESAMSALEGVARGMTDGECGNREFGRLMLVRYAAQGAIDRASCQAVELLGGNAFIRSEEVAYLLAATRGLSLHPPSRPATGKRLDEYLAGAQLILD